MAFPTLSTLLRVNAGYSLATGLVALVGAGAIADTLSAPPLVIRLVGAALIGFALVLAFFAAPHRVTALFGLIISALDGAWVLLMLAFVLLVQPSTTGTVVVMASSAPVAVFAVTQFAAAMRLRRPGMVELTFQRVLPGSAEAVWAVVTDHELYGQLARNLSRVGPFETVVGDPDRVVRRCWDVRGRYWDEERTSWQPNEVMAVSVDTFAPTYPYPLESMGAQWDIESTDSPNQHNVRITFRVQARPGVAGAAFVSSLRAVSPSLVGRIFDGWERRLRDRGRSA